MDFRLTTPVLASNCWTATPQSMVNELWEKTRGQLETLTGVIIQAGTPDAIDQNKMWVKTDGVFPIGHFIFISGKWLWPVEGYDLEDRRFWRGDLANLPTKDGGTVGVATQTTGPFWELDTDMNGRIAIGVGALPSGAVLAKDATGGVDQVTLATNNLPPHNHAITIGQSGNNNSDIQSTSEDGAFRCDSGTELQYNSAWTSDYIGYTRDSGSVVVATPADTLNPYLAGYWIKRTARKYYTG